MFWLGCWCLDVMASLIYMSKNFICIYIYIQHTEIDLDSVEPSFEVSLDLARGPRSGTFLPSERSLPHSWKVDGYVIIIYKKQMQHWSQKKNIVSCPSAYLSQYLWGLSFGHVCCQTCPRIILEKNNFKNGPIDFCVHSRLTPEFLCVLSIT